MTTDPQRIEVDDPRVLALAQARQQRAHKNPFNAGFCPLWAGLTEQEQRVSLLDARNYLRAAQDAGLLGAPSAVPPPAARAALRDRIVDVAAPFFANFADEEAAKVNAGELAAALLPVLPEPADRAAVLREQEQRADATERLVPRAVRPLDIEHDELMARAAAEHQARTCAEEERKAADRAALFREAANALAAAGLEDSRVSGPKAWTEAIETLRRLADEEQQEQPAAEEQTVTQLRWGLNDVMWGDDDTITVMLSGPAGEPYWLELEPDRAAVLRQDLAGPDGEPAAVTPPPALTEVGQLRAQVEVLQQDAERDRGLAKVGARCMRVGHQGLIEQGRLVLEGWRFALAVALGLDTEASWDAIHERVKGLAAGAQQPDTEARPARGDQFDQWLKTQRDNNRDTGRGVWSTLDNLLDLYRLHADTGTPLGEHVCEGRTVGDCEYMEPTPVTPQPAAAYSDGKGRVYCLACASKVAAEVPLTVEDVDHWELCPSCGRHVVGVAQAEQQPAAADTEGPRTVCVCGHTRAEHARVSGRLLCDACDGLSPDACKEFDAL